MNGPVYAVMFISLVANVLRIKGQSLSVEIGEVQKPYNLTCRVGQDGLNGGVKWMKKDIDVFHCNSARCESTYNAPVGYQAGVINDFTILTILKPSRQSEGKYTCMALDTSTVLVVYDFKVYARPESVTCGLRIEDNTVTVACDVSRVYPNSVCLFTWILNNTESTLTEEIRFETTSTQEDEYFNVTCTLSMPTEIFSLGSHKFKVLAYPNITGTDNDKVYGENSSQTGELVINYPVVQVDSNLNSSVEENTSMTVTCRETANKLILAKLSLSDQLSNVCSGLGTTTCNFTVRRNMTLFCQAELPNGIKSSTRYTPLAAYPAPEEVSPDPSNVNVGAIVGGTVAGILIVLVGVLIFLHMKRKDSCSQVERNMQHAADDASSVHHYEELFDNSRHAQDVCRDDQDTVEYVNVVVTSL